MTIIENANKAAEQFNEAMASLFPSYMANAVASTNLGGALVISFANVASVDDAPNKIIMNATGHMRFMMHLSDNIGKTLADGSPVEIELLTWAIPYKSEVIKYRKIKGKSPEEAMQKLFKWFEKNAEAIHNL